MKTSLHLNITLLGLLGVALPSISSGQTYQVVNSFSGSIFSGVDSGPVVTAFDRNPQFGISGIINGSVIIDPVASTIRETGTITIPMTSQALLYDTQIVGHLTPGFPNPPKDITASGQLAFDLSLSQGTFNFDTGVQPLSWTDARGWGFNGNVSISTVASLSYVLSTGGVNYSGDLPEAIAVMQVNLGSEINTANYPTSIVQSWSGVTGGFAYPQELNEPHTLVDVTAPNGFRLNVLFVPEPSCAAIVWLGAVGMIWRRRRNHAAVV
ncbi:MAG: hypothetical protein U1F98_13330 [Verrucomicrobiota bacterium]